MPPRSRYQYDEASGRYRSRTTGRFVSRAAVRAELDRVIERNASAMQTLGRQLQERTISVARFELQMRERIKAMHMASAAAARGGWGQMSPSANGKVGRELRDQYAYLRRFAREVVSGTQRRDGTLLARINLYARAARSTYEATRVDDMGVRGFDEYRSVLHPADHCGECVAEAEKGYQPLGTLTPVGDRECRQNDRCTWEFRNSATGAIAA